MTTDRFCTKSCLHHRRLSDSLGHLISFTPGFSQVNCARLRLETVLKRFPILLTFPVTRLKPGVNENQPSFVQSPLIGRRSFDLTSARPKARRSRRE